RNRRRRGRRFPAGDRCSCLPPSDSFKRLTEFTWRGDMGNSPDPKTWRIIVLQPLEPIAAACDLTVPEPVRKTIGIVGAGAITQVAHLPAYRKAGLTVAGICDLDA